jgi:hypothetical protein
MSVSPLTDPHVPIQEALNGFSEHSILADYSKIRPNITVFLFDVWHPLVLSVLTNSTCTPSNTTFVSKQTFLH